MIWIVILYILISVIALVMRAALRSQLSGGGLNFASIFLAAVVTFFAADIFLAGGREIKAALMVRVPIAALLVFAVSFLMQIRERDRNG